MKPLLALPVALLLAATAWAGWPQFGGLAEGTQVPESGSRPAPGAPAALDEGDAPAPTHLAAMAPEAPSPGPVETAESEETRVGDGETRCSADGEAPRVAVPRPPGALPLDVYLVDAETGRPSARASWTLAFGSEARLPVGRPAGTMPVKHARVAGAILVIAGPSEVAWDASQVDPPVSRYADRLAITYPLRREVTASVSVQTAAGRAPTGALDVVAWLGGRRTTAPWREASRTPPDEPGHALLEVPGIALLHGESLSLTVWETRGEDTFTVDWVGALGHDGRTRLDGALVLPETRDVPWEGPATNGLLSCSGGGGCGASGVRDEPGETGALALEVTRVDGRPAAGALVRVTASRASCRTRPERTLDGCGRARFAELGAGSYDVELREVGLVPTTREVRVRAGETTRLLLTENPGASLHVEVTDEDGHPLPFSTVEVLKTPSGIDWVDLSRDVERLDAFTDESGRRSLDRLGAGPTKLRARYGSRRVEETVDVPPSGSLPVRLIVR